jgi:hypothetical protein
MILILIPPNSRELKNEAGLNRFILSINDGRITLDSA